MKEDKAEIKLNQPAKVSRVVFVDEMRDKTRYLLTSDIMGTGQGEFSSYENASMNCHCLPISLNEKLPCARVNSLIDDLKFGYKQFRVIA